MKSTSQAVWDGHLEQRGLQPPGQLLVKPCQALSKALPGSVSSPQPSSPVCFQGQQWADVKSWDGSRCSPGTKVQGGLMQMTPGPFLVWSLLSLSLPPVAALALARLVVEHIIHSLNLKSH